VASEELDLSVVGQEDVDIEFGPCHLSFSSEEEQEKTPPLLERQRTQVAQDKGKAKVPSRGAGMRTSGRSQQRTSQEETPEQQRHRGLALARRDLAEAEGKLYSLVCERAPLQEVEEARQQVTAYEKVLETLQSCGRARSKWAGTQRMGAQTAPTPFRGPQPRYTARFPKLALSSFVKPSDIFKYVSAFKGEFLAVDQFRAEQLYNIVWAQADNPTKGALDHIMGLWLTCRHVKDKASLGWDDLTRLLMECRWGQEWPAHVQVEFQGFKRDAWEPLSSFNPRFRRILLFAKIEPTSALARQVYTRNLAEFTRAHLKALMIQHQPNPAHHEDVSVELLMGWAGQVEQEPLMPVGAQWGKRRATGGTYDVIRNTTPTYDGGDPLATQGGHVGRYHKANPKRCAGCHRMKKKCICNRKGMQQQPVHDPAFTSPREWLKKWNEDRRGKGKGKYNPGPIIPQKKINCFLCGEQGHIATNCPVKAQLAQFKAVVNASSQTPVAAVAPQPGARAPGAAVADMLPRGTQISSQAAKLMSLDDLTSYPSGSKNG
jgi:hypothetical protein